jgi:biotin carboxyl carrier protein
LRRQDESEGIKDLIELVNDKGFAEFEIERQGFRLRISPSRKLTTILQPAPLRSSFHRLFPGHLRCAVGRAARADRGERPRRRRLPTDRSCRTQPDLHIIKSPIVGTFYSAPSPTSEPFVRIGDHIEPDTVVCIIEAMKLMNEIQAEVSGDIVKTYVENGQPVEYGQALFGVKTG